MSQLRLPLRQAHGASDVRHHPRTIVLATGMSITMVAHPPAPVPCQFDTAKRRPYRGAPFRKE